MPVRVNLGVGSRDQGRKILHHLIEERLVAGGSIVEAEGVHWVGGQIHTEERRVLSAYTTMGKVPLIRGRLEMIYGSESPLLSQFVIEDEKPSVLGWIERNVRE